jgi:PadR family transcriptional regulator PadR
VINTTITVITRNGFERRGWLASAWSVTETGRRARFYKLTRTGRAQLEAETASWLRLTTAVADVMNG